MTQISGSLPQPVAPDYDRTLVLAIELSNKSWVLAAQVAGLARVKARQTIEPTAEALLVAIQGERATVAGRHVERVIATYEAGWSGFWLARWLAVHEIETYVVQPSSVLVDRRARRAKSDGIDAELLLRTLLAWLRGEPRVCSMVPIPSEADEDARRSVRERTELVAERVALVSRIGAVLATMGCGDYNPLLQNRRQRLGELRTAFGTLLPAARSCQDQSHGRSVGFGARANRRVGAAPRRGTPRRRAGQGRHDDPAALQVMWDRRAECHRFGARGICA